ncbi:hypothetical protein CDW43_15010 [Methylophaga nitratireducenticrescens]|nr:DUF935 family protein [Methylophaga nitratireducenticrescens]AUZ85792.1 hypothetical protein CDW43_15010 [Methylophaga nitratireducenticrescens]
MRHLKTNIFNMADAIGKCYSMHSIQWQEYGKIRLPKLNHQESRLFTIDDDDRNKLLMRSNAGKGEELWEFGWVSHIHKAKSGSIARGGLYRILAWPFIFKNYSIRDLAEFLEIYGIPLRTGKYPAGASDNEKSTLLRAVIGIGHNSAGIMPEGMEIDFHEAAKGQSDPFKFMIEWCESVQSKLFWWNTHQHG